MPSISTRVRAGAATAAVVGLVLTAAPALADAPPTAENFHKLRVCESSDNYRANTGNGYYGAYQFDLQTWHGLGYAGRPDEGSAYTQDQAARRLYDERGWSPWPSCSRQEGLR